MSSRVETLLKALSNDGTTIPEPQSRFEKWLYKALGYDVEVPEPQSRVETLFKAVTEVLSGEGQGVQKTIHIDSSVAQVTLPVIMPTVTAEINSNIIADSSASLEE